MQLHLTTDNEIIQLESWLGHLLQNNNQPLNIKIITQICKVISMILSHDDFEQLSDNYCQYYRMKQYWFDRYYNSQIPSVTIRAHR